MTIAEVEQEIIEEFKVFDEIGWESKYEHLIDLGGKIPLIEEKYKTDDRLIRGCQSQVWMNAELKDNKIVYTADSNALITKGMVALMIRVLSNQRPEDIINAELKFIDKIGLKEHLSPTRANGLLSMVKQMKLDAINFKTNKTQT